MLLFGTPTTLIFNRGSAFKSKTMKQFCKTFDIRHIKNAVATPKANRQCERFNETILNSLRCYSVDNDNENQWNFHLNKNQFTINSTVNKYTGKTPFQLLLGFNPKPIGDAKILVALRNHIIREDLTALRSKLKNKIKIEQDKAKAAFDKSRKNAKIYKVGDLILVKKANLTPTGKSKKLYPKFKGPFKIKNVLLNDRYVVENMRATKQSCTVVAVDSLKSWIVLNDPDCQTLP